MSDAIDPFDLRRFVAAQEPIYAAAFAELAAGRKKTHWMWFIFPQIAGLGSSPTAVRYAIGSRGEALAYCRPCASSGRGSWRARASWLGMRGAGRQHIRLPDTLKFRSSMTLFATVRSEKPLFGETLTPSSAASAMRRPSLSWSTRAGLKR